jgi:hypothetical protein
MIRIGWVEQDQQGRQMTMGERVQENKTVNWDVCPSLPGAKTIETHKYVAFLVYF